ncbi:hypothetical protein PsorP6_007079 [Peronosclerospora sorghi]|uniref:Uncharacterized protein n=1 Tax=Peronosclerospora sorghi TaxID=230839 RepID=A0ACC0W8M1_9STRA|nr:hypothetical protein PsorP6_007079 [Peronosclerospora sorghi]
MIEQLREWIRSSEGDSNELRESVLQAFASRATSLPNTWTCHRAAVPAQAHKTFSAAGLDARRARRVPPTFKENRYILNVATAGKRKLLTIDADDTSYEDGGSIN